MTFPAIIPVEDRLHPHPPLPEDPRMAARTVQPQQVTGMREANLEEGGILGNQLHVVFEKHLEVEKEGGLPARIQHLGQGIQPERRLRRRYGRQLWARGNHAVLHRPHPVDPTRDILWKQAQDVRPVGELLCLWPSRYHRA